MGRCGRENTAESATLSFSISENSATATPIAPKAATRTAAAEESFAIFANSLLSSVLRSTDFSTAVFTSSKAGIRANTRANTEY